MFNNYNKIFHREVLFEKVQKKSDVLFVYTNANFKLKNPIKHKIEQECRGFRIAELNSLKPCLYEEINDDYNFDNILGLQLLRVLQMAGLGFVNNLFVYDIRLLSNNKYVVAFVLFFLERKRVSVYTKSGLLPKEYNNFKGINNVRNLLRDNALFYGLLTFNRSEYDQMQADGLNED